MLPVYLRLLLVCIGSQEVVPNFGSKHGMICASDQLCVVTTYAKYEIITAYAKYEIIFIMILGDCPA